jgi:hypothetical protein
MTKSPFATGMYPSLLHQVNETEHNLVLLWLSMNPEPLPMRKTKVDDSVQRRPWMTYREA